jgi:hypothetical protein
MRIVPFSGWVCLPLNRGLIQCCGNGNPYLSMRRTGVALPAPVSPAVKATLLLKRQIILDPIHYLIQMSMIVSTLNCVTSI